MKFKVNETYYFVPSDTRIKPCEVKVSKIGKKYVYFEGCGYQYDMSIEAMILLNYGTRGSVFYSEEHYNSYKEALDYWHKITYFRNNLPSISEIKQLTKLLKKVQEFEKNVLEEQV